METALVARIFQYTMYICTHTQHVSLKNSYLLFKDNIDEINITYLVQINPPNNITYIKHKMKGIKT